jgi:hypothetical protein
MAFRRSTCHSFLGARYPVAFTLTIHGSGFVSGSAVNWNGSPRPTTFVSAGKITAAIPASDIATAATATITVKNPSPGGGLSNSAFFAVTAPTSSVTMAASLLSQAGALSTPTSATPSTVVVGDFNGDGKLDVVVSSGVLLGNGDGTFQPAIALPPRSDGKPFDSLPNAVLVAADLNNDGKLDLIIETGTILSVLLGNGDGSFQPATSLAIQTGGSGYDYVLGDFNSDGKLDLAVGTPFVANVGRTLSIYPGNGDGTFGAAFFSVTVPSAYSLATGDLNGDGKLDLGVCESSGLSFGPLAVFLSNGDGTFQTPASSVTCDLVIAFADLTGNGKLDVLSWGFNPPDPGGVRILRGNGDGTFHDNNEFVGAGLGAVADLNGDGKLDLFSPPREPGAGVIPPGVGVVLGNGDGSFQAETFAGTNAGVALFAAASGDFNGDGKMDLLAADGSRLWVLLNGVAPAGPTVLLSPGTLIFTSQALGTPSVSQSVTLTNGGGSALSITNVSVMGGNAQDFSQTNTCITSVLAAGATCQINVIFTPSIANTTETAAVAIADNAVGSPQNISLTGTTAAAGALTVSPLTLTFHSQLVGTSGLPLTVKLANTGSAPVHIASVTTTPADFGNLNACGASLGVGEACAIGVFFDPTMDDTRTGTLTIMDDAVNSPQMVALTGKGQDFSVGSGGAASATITAGQTATYSVTFVPVGGFTQPIALSCSGVPLQSTCVVTPSSLQLSGISTTTATVKVTTTARSTGFVQPFGIHGLSRINYRPMSLLAMGLALMMIVSLFVWLQKQERSRWAPVLAFALLLCVGLTLTSCGGGSGGNNGGGGSTGTPAGTYTITVSGATTSGSTTLTHATNLTLIVQ